MTTLTDSNGRKKLEESAKKLKVLQKLQKDFYEQDRYESYKIKTKTTPAI
jgi:hypothetical protein